MIKAVVISACAVIVSSTLVGQPAAGEQAGQPGEYQTTWGALKARYRSPIVQGADAESSSATVGRIRLVGPEADIMGNSVYYVRRGQELVVALEHGGWVNVIYTPCRVGNNTLTFWNTTWWMKSATGAFIKPAWTNAGCNTSPAGPWHFWDTWFLYGGNRYTKSVYAGGSNVAFRFYLMFSNYNPCPTWDCPGEPMATIHLVIN